jgi:predicted nucleic acid-binding protein
VIVIDASALVAMWFREPAGPPLLEQYRSRVAGRGEPAVAPDLLALELGNILLSIRRRLRSGMGSESTREAGEFLEPDRLGGEVLAAIEAFGVHLEPARPGELLPTMLAQAAECGLTAYDGVYLNMAWRLNATLCTLDAPLRRAALDLGIPVMSA